MASVLALPRPASVRNLWASSHGRSWPSAGAGWPKQALLHALLVATSLLVVGAVQVVWRMRGSPE